MAGESVSVLDGDVFAVSDRRGDMEGGIGDDRGLFRSDTRFLSRWVLTLNGHHPNVLSVDFTEVGALQATVRDLNGAIAKVAGVTYDIDRSIKNALNSGALTEAEAREIRGLHRLPGTSASKARTVLGPAAQYLTRPTALDKLEADNCVTNPPPTGLAAGPPIPAPFDEPLDPNPACGKAGRAGVTTTSTTSVP